jgi:hypothetical protein
MLRTAFLQSIQCLRTQQQNSTRQKSVGPCWGLGRPAADSPPAAAFFSGIGSIVRTVPGPWPHDMIPLWALAGAREARRRRHNGGVKLVGAFSRGPLQSQQLAATLLLHTACWAALLRPSGTQAPVLSACQNSCVLAQPNALGQRVTLCLLNTTLTSWSNTVNDGAARQAAYVGACTTWGLRGVGCGGAAGGCGAPTAHTSCVQVPDAMGCNPSQGIHSSTGWTSFVTFQENGGPGNAYLFGHGGTDVPGTYYPLCAHNFAVANVPNCTVQCTAGSFGSPGAQPMCQACDFGRYSAGVVACADCPAGKADLDYNPGTPCTHCPGGRYAGSRAIACMACVPGQYDDDGDAATPCVPCPIHTYYQDPVTCMLCPANSSTVGTGTLTVNQCQCSPGFTGILSEDVNSYACVACAPNSFKAAIGPALCSICPPNSGTLRSGTGSIHGCMCDPGYEGQLTLANPVCTSCVADTFKTMRSADPCSACALNSGTAELTGSKNQSDCICKPGSTKKAGTCISCAANTYKEVSGDAQCVNCANNSGTVNQPNKKLVSDCVCDPGQTGRLSARSSCREILTTNPEARNGIYKIAVGAEAFEVYCDMEGSDMEGPNGGGWTLVYKIADDSTMKTDQAVNVAGLAGVDGRLDSSGSGKLSREALVKLCSEQYKVIQMGAPNRRYPDTIGSGYCRGRTVAQRVEGRVKDGIATDLACADECDKLFTCIGYDYRERDGRCHLYGTGLASGLPTGRWIEVCSFITGRPTSTALISVGNQPVDAQACANLVQTYAPDANGASFYKNSSNLTRCHAIYESGDIAVNTTYSAAWKFCQFPTGVPGAGRMATWMGYGPYTGYGSQTGYGYFTLDTQPFSDATINSTSLFPTSNVTCKRRHKQRDRPPLYCEFDDVNTYCEACPNALKDCSSTFDPAGNYPEVNWGSNSRMHGFSTWGMPNAVILQNNYTTGTYGSPLCDGCQSSSDPGCSVAGGCHVQVFCRSPAVSTASGACSACAAGKYKEAPSTAACISCAQNAGTGGVTGSPSVSACVCDKGYEGILNTTSATCSACAPGTYKDQVGTAPCVRCVNNSGTGGSTASTEISHCLCNKGYEGTLTSPTSICTECPVDKYKQNYGTIPCAQCVDHASTNGRTGSVAVSKCYCKPGYQGPFESAGALRTPADTCVACPADTYKEYSDRGSNACTGCAQNSGTSGQTGRSNLRDCLCNPGFTGDLIDADAQCIACPIDHYKDRSGPAPCVNCARYSHTGGNTSATSVSKCLCLPGYHGSLTSNTSICTACPVDTYKDQDGTAPCTACAAHSNTEGKINRTTAGECLCDPGYWGTPCQDCAADSYKEKIGTMACDPCAASSGTMGETARSSVRHCKCDPGYTGQLITATAVCTACGMGRYKEVSGESSCTACVINSDSLSGSTSVSDCRCDPGYFGTLNYPAAQCSACPHGFYKTSPGTALCNACPSYSNTTYRSSTDVSNCLCNVGYTGTLNTVGDHCAACLPNTYKDSAGTAPCSDCAPHSSSNASSTSVSNCLCNPGFQGNLSSANATCMQCMSGKYKQLLGTAVCNTCTPNSGTNGTMGSMQVSDCLCDTGFTGTLTSMNSTCVLCGVATFKEFIGTAGCSSCPLHSTTAVIASVPSISKRQCLCLPGYEGTLDPNTNASCAACLPNTYKNSTGTTACVACANHSSTMSHMNASSVTHCLCNKGYQGALTDANSICTACVANTYKQTSGTSQCATCTHHATTIGETGSTSVSNCLCDPGYTGVLSSPSTVCLKCSVDTYKALAGVSPCTICPTNSKTMGNPGSTQMDACRCIGGYYELNSTMGSNDTQAASTFECEKCAPASDAGACSVKPPSVDIDATRSTLAHPAPLNTKICEQQPISMPDYIDYVKVNPKSKLVVRGNTSTVDGVFWEVYKILVDGSSSALDLSTPGLLDSSFTGIDIVVSSDRLDSGATYLFRLTGTAGPTSAATEVRICVNSPPTNGTFTALPSGVSEAVFDLSATQWQDDDLPLSYRFGFHKDSASVWLTVSAHSQERVLLPADQSNSSVKTAARIIDSYGAHVDAYYWATVQYTPTDSTVDWNSTIDRYFKDLSLGASQVVTMLADRLNQANSSGESLVQARHSLARILSAEVLSNDFVNSDRTERLSSALDLLTRAPQQLIDGTIDSSLEMLLTLANVPPHLMSNIAAEALATTTSNLLVATQHGPIHLNSNRASRLSELNTVLNNITSALATQLIPGEKPQVIATAIFTLEVELFYGDTLGGSTVAGGRVKIPRVNFTEERSLINTQVIMWNSNPFGEQAPLNSQAGTLLSSNIVTVRLQVSGQTLVVADLPEPFLIRLSSVRNNWTQVVETCSQLPCINTYDMNRAGGACDHLVEHFLYTCDRHFCSNCTFAKFCDLSCTPQCTQRTVVTDRPQNIGPLRNKTNATVATAVSHVTGSIAANISSNASRRLLLSAAAQTVATNSTANCTVANGTGCARQHANGPLCQLAPKASCAFWNTATLAWQVDGEVIEHENGSMQCAFYHLTDFAMALGPPAQSVDLPSLKQTLHFSAFQRLQAGVIAITAILGACFCIGGAGFHRYFSHAADRTRHFIKEEAIFFKYSDYLRQLRAPSQESLCRRVCITLRVHWMVCGLLVPVSGRFATIVNAQLTFLLMIFYVIVQLQSR